MVLKSANINNGLISLAKLNLYNALQKRKNSEGISMVGNYRGYIVTNCSHPVAKKIGI